MSEAPLWHLVLKKTPSAAMEVDKGQTERQSEAEHRRRCSCRTLKFLLN